MVETTNTQSHAGFFTVMALLAVAIAGSGYWWFTTNSVEADKEMTAQMNQPSHPPKNVKAKGTQAQAASVGSASSNER